MDASIFHEGKVLKGGASGEDECAMPPRLKVFDLHCDTLERLALPGDPLASNGFAALSALASGKRMESLAENDAHLSLSRVEPFSWCQCFAVFIPDRFRGEAAWGLFERVRRFWEEELRRSSDSLVPVRSLADIGVAHATNKTAGLLTVEAASFLEDDGMTHSRLDALARAGVRMVTLTWNGRNALGSGHDTDEGLTRFGRVVVGELERRDIVVDVSHLNDEGFKGLCDCAERPFAASHSNARSVCPHPRNLADWQVREIAARQGIVGLNYCRHFISDCHPDPSPEDMLRHIDHILEVAGEDVLALGSDYDGCEVPSWLDPCDRVSGLHALIAHEFGDGIAGKVFFGNALSFFARHEGQSR